MALPTIRISVVSMPPGLLVEALGRKREFTLPALRRLSAWKAALPGDLRFFRRAVGVPGVTLKRDGADRAVTNLDLCAAAIADRMIEGAPDFPDVESFENAVAEIIAPALRLANPDQPPAIELAEPDGELLTDIEIAGLLPVELLRFAEPTLSDGLAASRDARLHRYLGMRGNGSTVSGGNR